MDITIQMSSSTVSIPTHINNIIKSITAVLVNESLEEIPEKREYLITKSLELFYHLITNTNSIKQDDNQLPIDKIEHNSNSNSNRFVPIITNKSKMTVNNNIEPSQINKLSRRKNRFYLKSIRDPITSREQYRSSINNFINENIIKTSVYEDMISFSDIKDTYDEWFKEDYNENKKSIINVVKNMCNGAMHLGKVKINGELYWRGHKWRE